MAGLGLSDAVSGYQQGVAWKQDQEEIARKKGIQAKLDEANQAASKVVQDAEAEDYSNQRKAWLDSGAPDGFQPKPFTPPDNLMFKVSQDRGTALMRAGLIDEAVKNEAMTQAQRLRVRQNALERFRIDRDHAKLASVIYDTVPDGKSIVEAKTIEGAPAGDPGGSLAGMPMRPSKIALKLSDGTTHSTTPEEIEKIALRLSDPKFSEHEAAANLVRLKAEYEAEKAKDVEGYRADREAKNIDRRGAQERQTLGVKSEADMSLAQFNKTADAERTAGTNRTSLAVAATSAGASRYSADKRVEAAKAGKKATGAADKVKDFKAVHDEVTRVIGEKSNSMLGSGGRISGEDTLTISKAAKKAMDDYDLEPAEAIKGAIDHFVKSKGKAPK